MKRFTRWCSVVLLFTLLILSNVPTTTAQSNERLKVEPAHEWTELFNRLSDWVGADGMYTMPLNGVDSIGSADSETKTFFGFHDSILGKADPNTLE